MSASTNSLAACPPLADALGSIRVGRALNTTTPMSSNIRPSWARALTDPAAFAHEQNQLAQVWTVLCLSTDIPNDGDWVRATLGGRSVFVQRFGDTLRGFENRCAHRFYPLRTSDKGNGVIRCGFHHWQYDKDGRAVGIPKCQEMFGMTPRELGARLNPVEIATCGILIFGRFAAPDATETLEQFLGEAFAIVQAFSQRKSAPHLTTIKAAANWKTLFHISLDDYHLVAVHPTTFGKHGYLRNEAVRYFRAGRHSAYFNGPGTDTLADMSADCRAGTYRPDGYRIFQIFPSLSVVQLKTVNSHYILLMQNIPIACDSTDIRVWFFPAPFPIKDKTWMHRAFRAYISFWLPLFTRHYIRRIVGEDVAVCEELQTVAGQVDGFPILGLHEERIAWFEESYDQAMQAAPTPHGAEGGGGLSSPHNRTG